MNASRGSTRRDFLRQSTVAAVGSSVLGALSVTRAAHAQGSEVLRVALVGCGGRGNGAVRNCMNAPYPVKVVAVADAFEDKAKGTAQGLRNDARYKDKVDISDDRIFWGFDAYKHAIDCDIDIVILATTPGFRPWHYRYAIEKGRHVFMEKPCCVDAPGFRSLMETNKLADEKNLKVVVGLQRRHDPVYQETIKRIHDGAIGKLLFSRVYWNGGGVWIRGRQPGQTEMEYQMRNWYYFVWLSGDHICEQHIHNIDIANWVHQAHPVEANGMGGRQFRTGARFNNDVGHIYDHHCVEFTYPDGSKVFSQCRHIPNCWNSVSEHAHGTKGTSNCAGVITGENQWRYEGKRVNPYDQEHVDLIEAILKDKPLNDGWHGAISSFTAVLGRMATYSGKIVKWDEAVQKGPQEVPDPSQWRWDADPPVLPDENGSYEHAVAIPGIYKPY